MDWYLLNNYMNYLSFQYWFNPRPEPLTGMGLDILVGIIILLVILGIMGSTGMLRKLGASKKKASLITIFAFTNAFIGICVFLFNNQIIPYFRARIIYVIWFLVAAIWAWKTFFPKKKTLASFISEKEQEIKKYLPH